MFLLILIFIFLSINSSAQLFFYILKSLNNNFLNFWSELSFLLNNLSFNFLIIAFIISMFIKNSKNNKICLVFGYIFLLINKKIFINTLCYKTPKFYKIITYDLFDGLIQFHPFIFYTSIVILFIFNYFYKMLKKKQINWYLKFIPASLLVALFSGGYWSFLQLVWGYWWTWDNVELILFFIILLYTLTKHKIFTSNTNKLLIFINIYLILFLFIVFVRFGFFNSKHNFFDIDLSPTLYLTIVKITVLISFFYTLKRIKLTVSINYKKNKNEIFFYFSFLLWVFFYIAFNFYIAGDAEFFIYMFFVYVFAYYFYTIKNKLNKIYHFYFILNLLFIYYYKTMYITLNTQENDFYENNTYSFNYFSLLFFNICEKYGITVCFLEKNKISFIKTSTNQSKTLNLIMFFIDSSTEKGPFIYNIMSEQKVNNLNFLSTKQNKNENNIYLINQIYNLILPLYGYLVIIFSCFIFF